MAPLIVGNWKMHGTGDQLGEIAAMAEAAARKGTGNIWVAPPFTLIGRAAVTAAGRLSIGGQDCHHADKGAHTGCISAPMLAAAGAGFVILGHSERRADCGETDADVRAKAEAARRAGLTTIICVGETEAERDAGQAEARVAAQLAGSLTDSAEGLVVAYEPVWAIGTGRTPTPEDVAAMHDFIRARLVERFGPAGEAVAILYGGSVKPENASLLLGQSNVGGALVGGASLTAESFLAIAEAAGC